ADVEVGWRIYGLWFLDHAGNARNLCGFVFDADDAVKVGLILRHRRDRDVIAAVQSVGLHHVAQAWSRAEVEHVGKQQGEWLVADDLARAPNCVAKPVRGLLPRKARLSGTRQVSHQRSELLALAAFRQRLLQFVLAVKMVFDGRLVAARDKDEMLDARR